ncbi:MAG: AmmeMemoRadiSam system radical SAM enzyme, partial [bacterium]
MKRREFIIKSLATGTGICLAPLLGDIFGINSLENLCAMGRYPVKLKSARFQVKDANGNVSCTLCPNSCSTDNEYGKCRSRLKKNGEFFTEAYAQIAAIHDDPVEKAPLYHFYPGTRAVCMAAAGCNSRCKYCQNWQLSQESPSNIRNTEIQPEEAVKVTKDRGFDCIGFSYTEPMTYMEYVLDTFEKAKADNLKTYVVSGTYVNRTPFQQLSKLTDGFALALKGYDESFYRDVVGTRLNKILDILVFAKELGCHLEVVNLVVPTYNDDPVMIENMSKWIVSELGDDTPLHFLRFYPKFKLSNLPPTPISTLEIARKISMENGVKYSYIGNAPGHEGNSTYCPSCKQVVIGRIGFRITQNNIHNGKCKFCSTTIQGILDRIKLDDFGKSKNS